MALTGITYVPCGMCEKDIPLVDGSDPSHVAGGIDLRFHSGYEMFTDDASIKTVICHDCTIKLLALFPEQFKKQFVGGHYGSPERGINNGGICDGCAYSSSFY